MSDDEVTKCAEKISSELNSGNVEGAVAVPHGELLVDEIAVFERIRETNSDGAQKMLTYRRENNSCGWFVIDDWSKVISSGDDPKKVTAALMKIFHFWRYDVLDGLCERYPDLVSQISQTGDPLDTISILIKIRGKTPEESTCIVARDVVREFDGEILQKTLVIISKMLTEYTLDSLTRRYFLSEKMATMRAQIAIAGALIFLSPDLGNVATALDEFEPAVAVLVLHGLDPEIGAKILENMKQERVDAILGSIGIDFLRTEAILTAMRNLRSKRADPFFQGKEELFQAFKAGKLKVPRPPNKAFCLSIAHMPILDAVASLTAIDAELPEGRSYFYAWLCHMLQSEVPAFAAKAREVCGEIEKAAPDGSKLRRVISEIREKQQSGTIPNFPPEEPKPEPEA
jgi:hypothetical protein